jgi:hypothetical protein
MFPQWHLYSASGRWSTSYMTRPGGSRHLDPLH